MPFGSEPHEDEGRLNTTKGSESCHQCLSAATLVGTTEIASDCGLGCKHLLGPKVRIVVFVGDGDSKPLARRLTLVPRCGMRDAGCGMQAVGMAVGAVQLRPGRLRASSASTWSSKLSTEAGSLPVASVAGWLRVPDRRRWTSETMA